MAVASLPRAVDVLSHGAGVSYHVAYTNESIGGILDYNNSHGGAIMWLDNQTFLWDNHTYGHSSGVDLSLCDTLERYKRFRLFIDVFVVGLFIVGGFTGNTLAFLVMRADNMNNTVSYLLQALAVADNSYLLMCIFMQMLKALSECSDWIPGLKYTYPYMEPYIWPLASIAQTIGVWLVVLVTLDRYIAICHPFNTTYKGTTKKAKRASYIIVVMAIIYNIPRFFEHVTDSRLELCSNTTRLITVHSKLRATPLYFIVYKTGMYFLFRVILPLGVLTVLNLKLILALKGATQSHAALTRTAPARTDSFTRMLVVVVSVFILCELPTFIIRTIVTVRAFTGWRINVWYYATLSNLLLTINSSINCIIYCISGRRFRKILHRLFCRMCMTNKPHHHLVCDDGMHSNFNGTLTTITQQQRRSMKVKTIETSPSAPQKESTV